MKSVLSPAALGAVAVAVMVIGARGGLALTSAEKEPSTPGDEAGTSHALIIVGLPGDKEHERLFGETIKRWSEWLTGRLGFAPAKTHVLSGGVESEDASTGPATGEAIEQEIAAIRQTLAKRGRFWVFFLGHANHDGEHVWFHLPGPDLNEEQLARLFEPIVCREQVFWMTTSVSSRFLRSLSASGRIVITATAADDESNDTEFPYALATVAERSSAELDTDGSGQVSLLEMYNHTVAEVKARFAADNRVPTEHAQLDDNADGLGTEQPAATGKKNESGSRADGALAARTLLPLRDTEARQR